MLFKKCMRLFYIKRSIHENRINTFTVAKLKKQQWLKGFVLSRDFAQTMSSMFRFRMILRDLSVRWTRSVLVSAVVRRCRRDGVREVLQCFRQTILRPRRTLLLSATAACKPSHEEETASDSSEDNITDEELMALTSEMDQVEDLMRDTLYCQQCAKRLAIDKKQPGICYCACKACAPRPSEDGWEPYLEAEDVVIWRRQYKGPGLYAYKVYGRYKEVCARDFANVQLDTEYRRAWDSAVASLALIEQRANGLEDQALLHWEVIWPRLFANRDYVYLRRHKEYSVTSRRSPGEQSIIKTLPQTTDHTMPIVGDDRINVHSRARRKVLLEDAKRRLEDSKPSRSNKLFVIVSRSCSSDKAPETKHAIRVTEYWSQMVVSSIEGDEQPGMEFVLTYYDEPGVGGMPPGVASWAAGRAAPAYLGEMRRAAAGHRLYLSTHPQSAEALKQTSSQPPAEYVGRKALISEQDMESSKQGPELDADTNTEDTDKKAKPSEASTKTIEKAPSEPTVKAAEKSGSENSESDAKKENGEETADETEEDGEKNGSWWAYLYPFYYFV